MYFLKIYLSCFLIIPFLSCVREAKLVLDYLEILCTNNIQSERKTPHHSVLGTKCRGIYPAYTKYNWFSDSVLLDNCVEQAKI